VDLGIAGTFAEFYSGRKLTALAILVRRNDIQDLLPNNEKLTIRLSDEAEGIKVIGLTNITHIGQARIERIKGCICCSMDQYVPSRIHACTRINRHCSTHQI
jgi:hypothetical protein